MNSRISLNGDDWLFKDFHGEDWRWRNSHLPESRDRRHWRTGSVPGCPHHDLWRLGEIPDPYVEQNSLLIEWIPQRTWLYKKTFTMDKESKGQRVQLHFEGVDYQSEFFLNGQHLGAHTGMFTPAVFDVTELLRYGGENLLAAVIQPAPWEEPQVGRTSRVRTTKTRMNYWWDFCPRLVHLGIWDDVYLEVTGAVRIADVFVRPQLLDGFQHANIFITTGVNSSIPVSVDLEIILRQAGRVVAHERTSYGLRSGDTQLESCLELSSPQLWWPNGCGEQEMYEAEVRIASGEDISSTRTIPFGIRRIELTVNESAGPSALPYTFVVNGRKVYVKGWNWVPMDVMYSVPQPAKLERLLTLAKHAHVNLLRVWGGGLIEKKSFYQQCDRMGIMVWQEFIQSSSGIDNNPSTTPDFVRTWAEAAGQIIPRRRNHPSLAVWCGGNELSAGAERPLDDSHPVLAGLKAVVQSLDPDRIWLPTSPSGPVFSNSLEGIAKDPSGLHDVHGPWEYQGVTKQYELYNSGASLLHSEFGVEGVTNLRTLNATIRKEHQWPVDLDNPYWFHRGAWWIKRPMWDATFGELPDVETLARATQFMQADGLRYALEADRRRKYHNSGTLPWQFNEPYPMAACTSAVDYYARPKPVYYAVARAYAPLLVSARFPTLAWQGCEHFEAEVWVCNSWEQVYNSAKLRLRMIGVDGRIHAEREQYVSFGANCSAELATIRESLEVVPGEIFFFDLQLFDPADTILSTNRYIFSRTANLAPLLACSQTKLLVKSSNEENEQVLTITNGGETAAMCVWLEDGRDLDNPGYVYFDNNYFYLLPGESCTVISRWAHVPIVEQRIEVSSWNAQPVFLNYGEV